MRRSLLIALGLVVTLALGLALAGCGAAGGAGSKGAQSGELDKKVAEIGQKVDELGKKAGELDELTKKTWEVQPGLGTIMMEYGNRMGVIYNAAVAGNWGMAGYQLKEAREIQEVGETTRPKRADALKAFEKTYLDPLEETIKAKDLAKFKDAYSKAVVGCNGCHAAAGYDFIKFKIPAAPTHFDLTSK